MTLHIEKRVLAGIKLSIEERKEGLFFTPEVLQVLTDIIRSDVLLLARWLSLSLVKFFF